MQSGYPDYQVTLHFTDREVLVMFVDHSSKTQEIICRRPRTDSDRPASPAN